MASNFSKESFTSPRIAIEVEYDGATYCGWQRQKKPAVPTVQEQVEDALSFVANHPVSVICAGRTDSGVHATSQIVHFETAVARSEKAWVCGTNANLPDDVVIKWAQAVPGDFHARFSATARTYRYITLTQSVRSAIFDKKVTFVDRKLDMFSMQKAANYLLGEQDFSAYRGAGCQSKSSFRNVEYIKIFKQGDLLITEIRANAFLLHMVRNIMGVLIEIGIGEKPAVWAKEVLDSKDRQQGGRTAPPHGLYFVQAHYPSQYGLPDTAFGPAFIQE